MVREKTVEEIIKAVTAQLQPQVSEEAAFSERELVAFLTALGEILEKCESIEECREEIRRIQAELG